jgi:hypothetical protein
MSIAVILNERVKRDHNAYLDRHIRHIFRNRENNLPTFHIRLADPSLVKQSLLEQHYAEKVSVEFFVSSADFIGIAAIPFAALS